MMLVRLAWRNLWRNKRRSVIVLTSIVVGVLLMEFTGSYARGTFQQMFRNQLGMYTAHVQIHHRGYTANKVVERFMPSDSVAVSALRSNPNIEAFSRRTVTFGLLNSASASSGVSIIGVQPEDEVRVTNLHEFVLEGTYLTGKSHEIVISQRLARTLGVGLGDRVVAMASASDGTVGSELFRVVGVFRSVNLSFDKVTAFVALGDARSMLRAGRGLAEIAAVVRNVDSAATVKKELQRILGSEYEVQSYHDIMPSLVSQVEMMDTIMMIFFLIIGAAMVFGIVNTLLMSVFERIRELGVLKSIGMADREVFLLVQLEAVFLGLLGAMVGSLLALASNLILGHVGINLSAFSEGLAAWGLGSIIYPIQDNAAIIRQAALVIVICIAAAWYPARRAVKLEPIDAIRHV